MSGTILHRSHKAKNKSASGYINGFTVSSFLQVIELEQKTCTLELRAEGKRGRLYIQKGAIINAKTKALRGEKAAIAILGWKNAQIKLVQGCNQKIRRDIRSSLTRLILNASRNSSEGLVKGRASADQLTHAIHLAEGNHYKKAHGKIASYIKTNPDNSIAWLWYSRCLGNLKTISDALAKCFRLTPKNLQIIEEIHKLKQAYIHVHDKRVRRCPFCWAPLEAKGEQCHYCKAGLSIAKALDSSTQEQASSKFLISAVTRYTDVAARENNIKAIFYLSLANCNLNKVQEALDLLNEVSRINPDNKFLSDQLNIVVNHVTTRLADYTEYEDRSIEDIMREPLIGQTIQTQKKKILVVEDSPTTRKVVVLTLKQKGYVMVEARDGLEALGKVNEERPDLVLLDIILPKMDGYRILSIIRKTPELKDTPVILLTSKDGVINKVKGKLAGSTDYLTKPFETNDLIETVRKHIG
jgi:twitching motility two-component system response regulator PilG